VIKKFIIILTIICFSVVPLFAGATIYNGYVETNDSKLIIVDGYIYELNNILKTGESIIYIDKNYIIIKQKDGTLIKLLFLKA